MGLETATFISELVAANPLGSDFKQQGDNHLRLIKQVLQNTFPTADRAISFAADPAWAEKSAAFIAQSANYAQLVSDDGATIFFDCVAAARTYTLLPAVTAGEGFTVHIQRDLTATNLLTIDANGSETINGALIWWVGPGESGTLYCTGSLWLFAHSIESYPGKVDFFAQSSPPAGWTTTGVLKNRTTFARLFNAIGTAHGVGDGLTTFGTPSIAGRAVVGAGSGAGLTARTLGQTFGAETHTLTQAETPLKDHTHSAGSYQVADGVQVDVASSGLFDVATTAGGPTPVTGTSGQTGSASASAHNNMQPSIALTPFIKF